MAIVSDRNYGQILTASVARRSSDVQNIVYNSTPLTAILKDMGKIKQKRAGGPELRVPIMFDKLEAQWFTGYDKLQITPKELLNSAVYNWSRCVGMFSLTGTELLYNSGEDEVIDLMETYMDAAEQSVKEAFEEGLVGDGTADGGRQMTGLGSAVPIVTNTGVYGGIDRATVPNWRTSTFDIPAGDVAGYTTWDSTTARAIIEKITLQRSRGGRYPDLIIADANSYAAISAAFVAHQRLASERLARLGFTGMTIITPAGPVDVIAAGGIGNVMPADTFFGIDTQGMAIYTFPGQEFVPFHPGNGMRPINQDAVAQGVVWTGQLVLENPLFTYRAITA
jgi:hypothetical protein